MRVWAIALLTFREALRNQVLYSILFFSVFVVVIASMFGSVSVGDPIKFMKDFSFFSVGLFSVVIAVVIGVNLLNKEISRKSILNVFSKPVTTADFILGKFTGLWLTVALVVASMCAILGVVLSLYQGRFDGSVCALALTTCLELTIVVAIAIFFSSVVVTPTLAGMFTAAIFVAGRSAGYVQKLAGEDSPAWIDGILGTVYWLLPHLHHLNLADAIVYGGVPGVADLLALAIYAVSYSAVALLASVFIFARREFT